MEDDIEVEDLERSDNEQFEGGGDSNLLPKKKRTFRSKTNMDITRPPEDNMSDIDRELLQLEDQMSRIGATQQDFGSKPRKSIGRLSVVSENKVGVTQSSFHPGVKGAKLVEKYLKIDDFLEYILLTYEAFISEDLKNVQNLEQQRKV